MEQQIELPIQIETEIPPLGLQPSSSPPPSHPCTSPSSEPDQTAQDDDNCLHQELQNQLDLREEFKELNDFHEEVEEEEEFKSEERDKKSEIFYENDNESSEKEGDDLEKKNERSDENANSNRRYHQYPVRPEAEDCAFYMKTGTCKFGVNCKFNHPLRRKNQAVMEKVKEREEATEKPGQTECKGEKQCEFYMRNGSCKYGATCKYNHPDPMAVGGSDLTSAFVNGGTASLPAPSPSSVGSWSSPRALNDPTPFVPYVFSPTRLPSQSSEWNGYQGTLYPPERSLHPPPSYAMSNPATESNVYAPQQQQTIVDEFPERPGQQLCSYFMKFGDCKFKSNCKYHHPKNRIPKSPSLTLSDKGLPLRPDQIICSYYSRYGICKFGPACKFDHSIQPPSSGSCDDQHTAFGNSVTQEKARMAESGNGSDISVEQPV